MSGSHLEYLTGELILAITYGYQVQGRNDRRVDSARKVVHLVSETVLPGALLVNNPPFLRHIPEWLPWFSYKPLARYGYGLWQEVMYGPISLVRESMANGTARPSLALDNLQETQKLLSPKCENAEKVVAGALASMFTGGTHTTVSSLMSVFVAILLQPEIQTRAQEKLRAVTRRARLPTFEDRPRLPFVGAVCKEVLRWKPVVPFGIPHAATEDNVYEGFFIPEGTLVLENTWAILRDSVIYPDPDVFKPERFLNADGSLREDPVVTSTFVFWKRICPGKHLVDSVLFIVVASLFSVFTIEKGKGAGGGHEPYPCTGNGVSRPIPFSCSILPGDKRAEDLILAESLAP